jgi:hypothetical protein
MAASPSLWVDVRIFSGPLYILYLNFEREGENQVRLNLGRRLYGMDALTWPTHGPHFRYIIYRESTRGSRMSVSIRCSLTRVYFSS